jgi:predicted DNA-binding transcriptional regulator AlpA
MPVTINMTPEQFVEAVAEAIRRRPVLIMPDKLSVKELMAANGLKDRHAIYDRIKAGKLPPPRRGDNGRPYWLKEDLEAWELRRYRADNDFKATGSIRPTKVRKAWK